MIQKNRIFDVYIRKYKYEYKLQSDWYAAIENILWSAFGSKSSVCFIVRLAVLESTKKGGNFNFLIRKPPDLKSILLHLMNF